MAKRGSFKSYVPPAYDDDSEPIQQEEKVGGYQRKQVEPKTRDIQKPSFIRREKQSDLKYVGLEIISRFENFANWRHYEEDNRLGELILDFSNEMQNSLGTEISDPDYQQIQNVSKGTYIFARGLEESDKDGVFQEVQQHTYYNNFIGKMSDLKPYFAYATIDTEREIKLDQMAQAIDEEMSNQDAWEDISEEEYQDLFGY